MREKYNTIQYNKGDGERKRTRQSAESMNGEEGYYVSWVGDRDAFGIDATILTAREFRWIVCPCVVDVMMTIRSSKPCFR